MAIAKRHREARVQAHTRSPSLAVDLDRLFDAHRGSIQRLCRRLLADDGQAEELVQETLIAAYEKLHEFHGGARFSTWIYGIARNLCLNARRKRTERLTEDGVVDPAHPAADVLRLLQRSERASVLQRVSASTLTAAEQEAVQMRYVLDLPLPEIEHLLGVSQGQARVILQRCKRKLSRGLTLELERLGHGHSLFNSRS